MLRILLLAVLAAATGPELTQPELPANGDWAAVDAFAAQNLLERDRGAWVRELLARPMPEEVPALMLRLNLLLRDGRHLDRQGGAAEAQKTLAALARHAEQASDGQWSAVVDSLIDRKADDLATRALELLPRARPWWGQLLVGRLLKAYEKDSMAGPSALDRLDQWLLAREAAARQSLEARPTTFAADAGKDYWFDLRVQLHRQARALPVLIEALERDLRARPQDMTLAIQCARAGAAADPPRSPQWMLEVVKPPGPYDAFRLGQALSGGWPAVAAAVYEQALALPFGDADERAMQRLSGARALGAGLWTRRDFERALRWETRAALARAYQASGQAAKAQPLLEALAAEGGGDVPPSLAELAGEVQAATGARVIQQRLVDAEPAKADDPDYWRRRAEYFAGRGESTQTEEAFARALALLPLEGAPALEKNTFVRSLVVGDYAHWLRKQGRQDDAVALIWREFDSVDPATEYAGRMIDNIWGTFRGQITLDNARVWRWLAARPVWEHLEEHVVYCLAGAAGPQRAGEPDHRAQAWEKLLPLVKDGDPSRTAVLAWVMTRQAADARAVPLLRDLIGRLQDAKPRERATFNLFEAYLHLNDARNAEALWPQVRRRLDPRQLPDWVEQLIKAAEAAHDAPARQRWVELRANLDHRYADAPGAPAAAQ